jgi:very-short-patch-repair endonuclease
MAGMAVKKRPALLDVRLAAVAQRQYGLVTRRQLEELGLGSSAISERVRSGRLHRVTRGVYSVGHVILTREGHWLAAVLTCGPGAVLSHASAAALWEIRPTASPMVDVTVSSRAGLKRRRRIRVHRSGRLAAADVTVLKGIPVTTVARTLLDIADTLSTQPLRRVIHEAEYRELLDMTALAATVERNPGRKGAKVISLAKGPLELTRYELEKRFLAFCRRHHLPSPAVNAIVHGFEVDFLWKKERLIVETDGLAAHRTRQAMERDRTRDRRLLRAGYRTIRLTSRALSDDADAVLADLRALLAQAGTSSARRADRRSRSASKPPRRSRTSSASAR